MTESEFRQFMNALALQNERLIRMETKFDALKEDVEQIKGTNTWLLRSLGAAMIPLVVGALIFAIVLMYGGLPK